MVVARRRARVGSQRQPGVDAHAAAVSEGAAVGRRRQDLQHAVVGRPRHDADDLVTGRRRCAAYGASRRVAAETILPEPLADDHDAGPRRAIFVARNARPTSGSTPSIGQQRRRHGQRRDTERSPPESGVTFTSEPVNAATVASVVARAPRRHSRESMRARASSRRPIGLPDHGEPVGVGKRRWLRQHGAQDAEHGDVGADAEGEHDDHEHADAAMAQQRAQRPAHLPPARGRPTSFAAIRRTARAIAGGFRTRGARRRAPRPDSCRRRRAGRSRVRGGPRSRRRSPRPSAVHEPSSTLLRARCRECARSPRRAAATAASRR